MDWLGRHPVLWRLAALLVAGGLGFGALVMFAFGTCHDSGGFCAGDFRGNLESYVSAVVLAALAAPAAVVTLTRRPLALVAATIAGGGVVALLAAVYESGT